MPLLSPAQDTLSGLVAEHYACLLEKYLKLHKRKAFVSYW
jgi:hypothetical protein